MNRALIYALLVVTGASLIWRFVQDAVAYPWRFAPGGRTGHDPAYPLLAAPALTMSVELDHAIVPSHDPRAAAELLATLLGVPWAESGAGPFCPVYVNEGLTLDFDQADGPFPVQHYCFRVSEARFDGIVTRIKAHGIEYRSAPHGPVDMQVNTRHGGRIVYWNEPDGHVWEALTVSYARQRQPPQRA